MLHKSSFTYAVVSLSLGKSCPKSLETPFVIWSNSTPFNIRIATTSVITTKNINPINSVVWKDAYFIIC